MLHDPATLTAAIHQIAAEVRPLDERLWAIVLKNGPLTADEQAYLDAAEAASGGAL